MIKAMLVVSVSIFAGETKNVLYIVEIKYVKLRLKFFDFG